MWPAKRSKRHGGDVASDSDVDDALLLHRICDVMLKAVKTGRPLVHLIKAWAIVGPHLIEVVIHVFVFILSSKYFCHSFSSNSQ
jgi:brefeldin A-inhibited guanine nucleotide-exchange protein 3